MHFYPGAVHAAAPIVEAAAKIPGLLECLRAGDLPAPLLEAINASGLDIFMRRPGSIQFDPGMMSSECALLIAAFMHDLELDPGRWFKFIGIDFQKTADEALSAAGDNHAAPQSPDGPAAETLSEAQANAASAANAQEPLFAAGEALTGTFPFADLEDDMELAEAMIKYVISYVMESCKSELEFLNKFVDKGLLERLHSVVNSDFARVTYTDAVKELEKYNDEFDYKVYWGCDLQTEHERCLTERIFKRPVFVTDYPKEIKAFYMRLNDDGKTVAAVDLLVMGIGEIIGGSQREERLDVLTERIEELGLDPKDYWWYLDLRRYGGVKHSGFGLGFERLVMYLTGISNIRDVLPFPRTTGSADF